MSAIDKFLVKREPLERLTFVGPAGERNNLLDELGPLEYRIIQSGPHYTKKSWPTVDTERFLLIVEREVPVQPPAASSEHVKTIDAIIEQLRDLKLPAA